MDNYTPASQSIVVKRLRAPDERVTAGGIIVPKTDKRPTTIGRVIRTGDGVHGVKVGELVLYTPYAGFSLVSNGEEYLQIGDHEILGFFTGAEDEADIVVT